MLTKVAHDIHKLVIRYPGGMGEGNCYLINGEKGYTVIDTGIDSKEAKETWEKLLLSGIAIEKVVLTHTHRDHIGLAKWFQQHVDVPVFVSDLSYKEMQKIRNSVDQDRLNRLVIKHGGLEVPDYMRDDSAIYDFEPDGFFENNQEIQLGKDCYETIWTPGHAPDHFCFYNRKNKVMIIGDHLLKEINPVIGLWSGEEENPLKDYFTSLKVIKNYPADLALPGHGDLIYHLHDRVDEAMNKHNNRLQQVLASVESESKTADQVCYEIYGTADIILNLSSFMATLTRLLYLESGGKVVREEVSGKVTFQAIPASRKLASIS